MALDPKDLELLERLIYKNADDIAVAIGRSFERLEERMDATESRVLTRFADMDNAIERLRADVKFEAI